MKAQKVDKIFLFATIIVSVISITGFDVIARISIGAETLMGALVESLYYSGVQIIGTLMLMAPFLALGGIAAAAAKKDGIRLGLHLFICGAVLLMGLYLKGHLDSIQLIEQERWTSSALSIGLLPFESVPVLTVGLGLGWILSKLTDKR